MRLQALQGPTETVEWRRLELIRFKSFSVSGARQSAYICGDCADHARISELAIVWTNLIVVFCLVSILFLIQVSAVMPSVTSCSLELLQQPVVLLH